ncbi:DUF169 domain-containing protein [Chloroflexota bacterium]
MTSGWAEKMSKLDKAYHLRTLPVAVKLFEKAEDLEKIEGLKKMRVEQTICQRISAVRMFGFATSVTAKDTPPWCSYIIGLCEIDPDTENGWLTTDVWCETQEDAKKRQDYFPMIPPKFEAAVFAPVEQEVVEPDVILIYGDSLQITMMLSALCYKDYERFEFIFTGGSSCAVSIARTYLTDKPQLSLPDFGERRYGHAQADELTIGLPPRYIDKMIAGTEFLRKTGGIYYPAPFSATQYATYPAWPRKYRDYWDRVKKKKGWDS